MGCPGPALIPHKLTTYRLPRKAAVYFYWQRKRQLGCPKRLLASSICFSACSTKKVQSGLSSFVSAVQISCGSGVNLQLDLTRPPKRRSGYTVKWRNSARSLRIRLSWAQIDGERKFSNATRLGPIASFFSRDILPATLVLL